MISKKYIDTQTTSCYSLPCLSFTIRALALRFRAPPIPPSDRRSAPSNPSSISLFNPSNKPRHVTKNLSPQLLYFPHLQTVTPVTPLESALTQTAGCHSPFSPTPRRSMSL